MLKEQITLEYNCEQESDSIVGKLEKEPFPMRGRELFVWLLQKTWEKKVKFVACGEMQPTAKPTIDETLNLKIGEEE